MTVRTRPVKGPVTAPAEPAGDQPPTDPPPRRIRRVVAELGDSLFIGPALIGMLAVFFLPSVVGIYRSFTDWVPGADENFVGLQNYQDILADETFHTVLRNTLVYLIGIPLGVIIPLVIAFMLYERTPQASVFRTIYLVPMVFSPAILGLLFQSVLNPDGLLNSALKGVGLDVLAVDWLGEPEVVKFTIIGTVIWGWMGVYVLMFHAALSSIPPELFEAADLDGASWWKKLRYVMMPGVRPVLQGIVVVATLHALVGYFGMISVLTDGGPNYASTSLEFDVYTRAFKMFDYGRSAAEAVLMLFMMIGVALLLMGLRAVMYRQRRLRIRTAPGPYERVTRAPAFMAVRSALAPLSKAGARIRALLPHLRWSPVRLGIAVVLALAFVYPMLSLMATALRTQDDYESNPVGVPAEFTTDFVTRVWSQAHLGEAFINSFISVGIAVVIVTLLATAGAFWFLRHQGPVRAIVVGAIALIYFVPGMVWLIPLNSLMVNVGLNDTLLGLGIVQGFQWLPFGLILMTTYLSTAAPPELLEAARIDGASLVQQFLRIVLPLSRPGLAALISLVTAWVWGEYATTLVLIQDQSKFTVTIAATQLVGKAAPGVQPSAAVGLLSMLPMLVLFIVTQRWMVKGINAGTGRI